MNRDFFVRLGLCLSLAGAAACGGSTPPPATSAAPKQPSRVYTAYVEAIGNAGAMSEVHPFLSAAARGRAGDDLEALKAKMPAGVLKFEGENIEGDKATLQVSATVQNESGQEVPATGTVVLILEDGGWKVDQEEWVKK